MPLLKVKNYLSEKSKKLHVKYGTLYLVMVSLAVTFLIGIIGASVAIQFESDADGASLVDFWNALYWAFATMSTVGYGDYYPITPGGKITANIIMAIGIGLYSFAVSLITGLIIHNLMSKSIDTTDLHQQNARIEKSQEAMNAKLDEVLSKLEKQQSGETNDLSTTNTKPN